MWARATQSSTQTKIGALVLTLLPLYYLSYKVHPTFSHKTKVATSPEVINRVEWQRQWLETDVLRPFDPLDIQMKCNETKWDPDLVFNLRNANGGVGNIRAEHLDFLFYAMEMGASIILPGMAVRREDELFDVWGAGNANFSNMFDEDWFRKRIAEACPQMEIYEPSEHLEETTWRKVGQMYDPRIPQARKDSTHERWIQQTRNWFKDHNVTSQTETWVDNEQETKTIVDVEHTMWETNTRGEHAAFRLALGKLIRVRPDVRRYAAIAMSNFALSQGIHIKPTDGIHQKAFYGAHLRTESDTISAGWLAPPSSTEVGLNYTAQTDYYLDAAVANDLRVIFAASGNASEIENFKVKAGTHQPPVVVLSKFDLLSDAEGEALRKMHWDQQALVDLEILKRCSVFGGMAKSSFAFMIAMVRTAWMEERSMLQDPWFAPQMNTMVAFDNELSTIWGRNQLNEERVPKGAWP